MYFSAKYLNSIAKPHLEVTIKKRFLEVSLNKKRFKNSLLTSNICKSYKYYKIKSFELSRDCTLELVTIDRQDNLNLLDHDTRRNLHMLRFTDNLSFDANNRMHPSVSSVRTRAPNPNRRKQNILRPSKLLVEKSASLDIEKFWNSLHTKYHELS